MLAMSFGLLLVSVFAPCITLEFLGLAAPILELDGFDTKAEYSIVQVTELALSRSIDRNDWGLLTLALWFVVYTDLFCQY